VEQAAPALEQLSAGPTRPAATATNTTAQQQQLVQSQQQQQLARAAGTMMQCSGTPVIAGQPMPLLPQQVQQPRSTSIASLTSHSLQLPQQQHWQLQNLSQDHQYQHQQQQQCLPRRQAAPVSYSPLDTLQRYQAFLHAEATRSAAAAALPAPSAAVLRQHVTQAVWAAEQQRQGAVSVGLALQQMQAVQAMLASQARTQTSGRAVITMSTGMSSCAGGGLTGGLSSTSKGGCFQTGGYLYGQTGFRVCEDAEGRLEAEGVPSTDELLDMFDRLRAGRVHTWCAALDSHQQQQQQVVGPALHR
jgi:hypothetical protein